MKEHFDFTFQYSNFRMSKLGYLHCSDLIVLRLSTILLIPYSTQSNRRQLLFKAMY